MIVLAALFFAASSPAQDIEPGKILSALGDSSISLFAVFILSSLIGTFLRAIRYRILIIASGEPNSGIPTLRSMILITAIRGMVVDLLPARLGELIYVGLLKKYTKTSIPAGLSSLMFALLLDIAILAPITILLALIIGFPNSTPLKIALIAGVLVTGFYVAIRYVLPGFMRIIENHTYQNSLIGKLFSILNQLNMAIQATLKAGVFTRVVFITVAIRFLKYFGLLILFYGLTRQSFPDLAQIPNLQVLSAMIASEMTAALPIPTLMSFGAWEIGGMTFLAFFGAPPQDSLLALITLHIQTQAVDYGIGFSALFLLLFNKPSETNNSTTSSKKSIYIWLGIFCFAVVSAIVGWMGLKDSTEQYQPIIRTDTIPISERPDWLQDLQGFIVWSSSRMGNHNIMIMDLDDLSIRPLTIHPHTETHPRISPDGKQVAFTRSVNKWQSWRNQRPWNIWLIDLETGKEKKIIDIGTAPTWSNDGNTLYFQRTVGEVWSYDLDSEEQTRLFQKNTNGLPNEEFFWPSIDSQGRLAVSFRDRGRPTNIIAHPSGEVDVVAMGCMVMWSPKNDFAIYVTNDEGGKHKNQFNRYDPETGETRKWLDLPGELSHEYFPRLDSSQQYLVFAASDGAHEPDLEDYEIFIWKTDTPDSEAQRLTFEKSNDSWPDIFIKK